MAFRASRRRIRSRAFARAAALGAALGLAMALAAGPVSAAAEREAPRAAPGTRLVHALEASPRGVVGVVRSRRALEARGYAATLEVERALAGDGAAGSTLEVAWEERAPSRAPRFDVGERVLVALEPLPGGTLWRTRFPAGAREGVWHVAQEGKAFLREPGLGAMDTLEHYLRLAPSERRGEAGAARLAALAASAPAPLAHSAVAALADPARPGGALGHGAAEDLVAALGRAEPALRSALLELAARRPSPAFVAALRRHVEAASPPPAVLVEALGRAEGRLEPKRAEALLTDAAPARRAAAARHAPAEAANRLAGLVAGDRAPEVRAAATERLLELKGVAGIDVAAEALADPVESVRLRAARALAALGEDAIPRLAEVARRWPQPAPQAAILGLSLTQETEAVPILESLADGHADPAVRRLAEIALGRDVGHSHGE